MFSPTPTPGPLTALSSNNADAQSSSTSSVQAELQQADNIDIGLMEKSLETINLIISELADRPGIIEDPFTYSSAGESRNIQSEAHLNSMDVEV